MSSHGAALKLHLFFRIFGLFLGFTIPLEIAIILSLTLYSAGIDFSRQNLTSVDVRF